MSTRELVRTERPIIAMRYETDSLGVVEVPADKLCSAQTERVTEAEFDRVADPAKMVQPYIAEP